MKNDRAWSARLFSSDVRNATLSMRVVSHPKSTHVLSAFGRTHMWPCVTHSILSNTRSMYILSYRINCSMWLTSCDTSNSAQLYSWIFDWVTQSPFTIINNSSSLLSLVCLWTWSWIKKSQISIHSRARESCVFRTTVVVVRGFDLPQDDDAAAEMPFLVVDETLLGRDTMSDDQMTNARYGGRTQCGERLAWNAVIRGCIRSDRR